MLFLDIIVGYYLPSIFGWLFFLLVVILEGALLSKMLFNFFYHKTCYRASFLANALTTLVGFSIGELILKDAIPSFGHLITWIPLDRYDGEIILSRTYFIFILSYILTLILETVVYYWTLKPLSFSKKNAIISSLKVNTLSYLLGAIILYIYSQYLF